jgi:hypothetical protein
MYRYLIRDRDAIYGAAVTRRLRALGIRQAIAPGSPWQNCFTERLIETIVASAGVRAHNSAQDHRLGGIGPRCYWRDGGPGSASGIADEVPKTTTGLPSLYSGAAFT